MPLVKLGDHYAVTVRLNNADYPMLVDTGAGVTALKASFTGKLKLPLDPQPLDIVPTLGIGQTQATALPSVIVRRFGLGALEFHDRGTVVANIDDGLKPEKTSIGLLGDDILSHYDVDFDFPGGTLSFYEAADCFDTFTPWGGDYTSQPIRHRNSRVTVDVMLDGERTEAIVDTGANGSFVARRASAFWSAPDSAFVDTDATAKSPLNNADALPETAYLFHRVTIAGEEVDGKVMPVIDTFLPDASALVGLDFWASKRIWISYPTQMIFVAKPPGVQIAYPVVDPNAPPAAAATVQPPASAKQATAE